MAEPLPCRSAAEAHVYLDLLGAASRDRAQRLEARDDDLVSVYTVTVDGQRREVAFRTPEDPLGVQGFGGGAPSEIIDAGQWLLHGDRLARSVPADPTEVPAGGRAEGARRLEEAARCVDEVLKFMPDGTEQMPEGAFWTPMGKATWRHDPGRFRRFRLVAVAQAYREAARDFAVLADRGAS